MQTLFRSILILTCLVMTSCNALVSAPQPTDTITDSSESFSTPTITETLPATQTFTPEPIPTLTPTKTPMPQINLPIIMENGQPKFDFTKGFSVLPFMEELSMKFGEELFSQALIGKWHEYLATLTVNGQQLVKPLADPSKACGLRWQKNEYKTDEFGTVSRLLLSPEGYIGRCTEETFPVRPVAAFRDNLTSLVGVTVVWWDPVAQKDLYRTFVYNERDNMGLAAFSRIGVFPTPVFDLIPGPQQSDPTLTMSKLNSYPGDPRYPGAAVDAALNAHGIYDPLFDRQVIIAGSGPAFYTLSPSE